MDKRGKSLLVISAIILIISVIALYFVFAAFEGISHEPLGPIQEDENTRLNFSIVNLEIKENITNLSLTLPGSFNITNAFKNGTTASSNFSITSNGSSRVLQWNWNVSEVLIPPTENRTFWINVTAPIPGNFNMTVDVRYSNGTTETVEVGDALTVNDTQFPVVNSTGPVNGAVYNESTVFNFSCNASDDGGLSGIVLVFVNINNGPWIVNRTYEPGNLTGIYNQTNFSQTIMYPGKYSWFCRAFDNYGHESNTPTSNITVNALSINGWVKNSTYNAVSGANVSIYEEIMQQNGPPILRIIKSATTGFNGNFTLANVRGNRSWAEGICEGQCETFYRVKVTLNNSAGLITEVGPALPTMPSEPLVFGMNNGTFYLQNAVTLQLYANNGTSDSNKIKMKFGYEVIDNSLGFPIESNVQNNVSKVNVTVPVGRAYTVMYARSPDAFPDTEDCFTIPGFLNDTNCPSPPVSVNINASCLNASAFGAPQAGCNTTEASFGSYLITLNKSLAYINTNLKGCFNIIGNTTPVSLVTVKTKMIPWTGFIPPMNAMGNFDVTDSASYSAGLGQWGCSLGNFSIQMVGAANGIEFMVEAYANGTNEYFAAFRNITMYTADANLTNLTLVRLLGAYTPSLDPSDVNTSKIEIAISDENGTAPSQAHVEVYVVNNASEKFHYIIESLNNGKFNFTVLNNTREINVRVFSSQYAPKEQKIRLNTNRTNVTLYSFKPQMIGRNGSVNDSKMSGNQLTMRFMRNSVACNVYTPDPAVCRIGDDQNANFDPMQAMMAGKSNLWMKTSSNVVLYFINVDMMASGPPDAMMSEDVSSASGGANSTSLEQVWKFGSMAPDVYDYVLIGIPYNKSVNETALSDLCNWSYSVNLSVLYDNDWNVIWSSALNGNGRPALAEYSDFNDAWFNSGMVCSGTASPTTEQCYMDKTNDYFWLHIPHFSSTATKVMGVNLLYSASGGTPTTAPGGGDGGTTYDLGTIPTPETRSIGIGDTIKFSVGSTNHTIKLVGLTLTRAALQIKTTTIILTRNFEVNTSQNIDVNNDGKADIEITLKSLTVGTASKASVQVKSLVVEAASETPTPEQNITQNQTGTPEGTGEAGNATQQQTSAKSTPYIKWILIVSVILIAIVAIILIIKVIQRKN